MNDLGSLLFFSVFVGDRWPKHSVSLPGARLAISVDRAVEPVQKIGQKWLDHRCEDLKLGCFEHHSVKAGLQIVVELRLDR